MCILWSSFFDTLRFALWLPPSVILLHALSIVIVRGSACCFACRLVAIYATFTSRRFANHLGCWSPLLFTVVVPHVCRMAEDQYMVAADADGAYFGSTSRRDSMRLMSCGSCVIVVLCVHASYALHVLRCGMFVCGCFLYVCFPAPSLFHPSSSAQRTSVSHTVGYNIVLLAASRAVNRHSAFESLPDIPEVPMAKNMRHCHFHKTKHTGDEPHMRNTVPKI